MLKYIFVLLALAALSMSVIAAPPRVANSTSSTTQATTTTTSAAPETTVIPTEDTTGPEAAESGTLGLAEILSSAASMTLQQERESIQRAIQALQASLASSLKATRNVIRAGGNLLIIVPKWGYNTVLNKEPIKTRPWYEIVSLGASAAEDEAEAAAGAAIEAEAAAAAEAEAAVAAAAAAAVDSAVEDASASVDVSVGVSAGGSASLRPIVSSTRKYDFLYHD